jgi:hypothetical protein
MKRRYCDHCKKEIIWGEDYYKISFLEHKDKKQLLNHKADACIKCFGELFK